MPIIMMADRATTGGYTKIATVITPDLHKLAQMGPGCKINFKKVSLEEASGIYRESEKRVQEIKEHIEGNRFDFSASRSFNIHVKGKEFKVDVNEIL